MSDANFLLLATRWRTRAEEILAQAEAVTDADARLKIMVATLFGIISAIGGAIGGAIFGTFFGVVDAWIRGAVFGAIVGGILVLHTTIIAAIRYWRTERRRSRRRAKGQQPSRSN